MLEFVVKNQKIIRVDSFSPAEKSVNYLMAKFLFETCEWEDTVKTALFKNKNCKEPIEMMLQDDVCLVPWEILQTGGKCEVSVNGYLNGKKITTDIETFFLRGTISGGSASREPTPSVFEQLLEKMEHIDGGTFEEWKE